MTPTPKELPALPKAAYSLDLNDGHPVVAYSVQQMYDFAREHAASLQGIERDAAPRWQSIESAPKDGASILVFCNRMVIEAWWSPVWNHFVRAETGGTHLMNPTHWMPLPAAPDAAMKDAP